LYDGITCLPWRDPAEAMTPFADEPFAGLLLSGGQGARWSYLVRAPESVVVVTDDRTVDLANILAPLLPSTGRRDPRGPPFQGGVVGVATYELAHAFETIPGGRRSGWPQLVLARYDALLAFDHAEHRVLAVGPGSADWLGAASSSGRWAGPLCGKVRSLTSAAP
jgi:para-aminobenzoate synthetase component 1